MATPDQSTRFIGIDTPLGENVLLLAGFSGNEELGRLFEFQLDLLSTDAAIKFEDIIGQPVTVRVDLPSGGTRYFDGMISRFVQVSHGDEEDYARYEATMVPALWFLTRTSDCRIFQNKQALDIIKEVLSDHGFTDIEERVNTGDYRTWEYCAQYRETDCNFISRLMEQEGIYYYFDHEDGKHTLVLCDSLSKHDPYPEYEEIAFRASTDSAFGREDISDWTIECEVQPGSFAHTDFNFTKPATSLGTQDSVSRDHDQADHEIFDYPGEYTERPEGEQYAKVRIQELQARHEVLRGAGDVRGICPGFQFKMTDHPRDDQNREYLVTSATYSASTGGYGSAGEGDIFDCQFAAIDATTQFRPERVTPKPVVQGVQTAVVVGPSGEDIHTDKYGRVKVQFHWDREGKSDQDSSCWVRVSQNWAGAQWGGMFIPHKGQEVIVEFLEGDPDRPIITGRVYNEDNMPPCGLPGSKTQSIIRDHGNNQIHLEGAGPQFIHLQQSCGNEVLMDAETPSITVKQANGNEAVLTDAGPEIHLTQPCGNKIVMLDGAGIHIEDQYGNKVVLDAAAGTLTMESPTHSSRLILGQSIDFVTGSNKTEVIDGWNTKQTLGNSQEFYLGLKSDTKVGLFHDTLVGGKFTGNIAADIQVTGGVKVERGKVKKIIKYPMVDADADVLYTLDAPTILIDGNTQIQITSGSANVLIEPGLIELDAPMIKLKGDVVVTETMEVKKTFHADKGKLTTV